MLREGTMAAKENVETMREIFRAIEDRDLAQLVALTDPAAEFHWPPSLPYGGILPLQPAAGPSWAETWIPLQPTKAEQRMDARIVAASDDEVVVLWHQRGISLAGEGCYTAVVGRYLLRHGNIARCQLS